MPREREVCLCVIARSEATEQSTLPLLPHGLLRFARDETGTSQSKLSGPMATDNRGPESLYQPGPARPGFWRWIGIRDDGIDTIERRLDDRRSGLFRCWHRGTREMDLILGRFADGVLAN